MEGKSSYYGCRSEVGGVNLDQAEVPVSVVWKIMGITDHFGEKLSDATNGGLRHISKLLICNI